MRIVLQNVENGLFYLGNGDEWTDAINNALVYRTSAQALSEALRLEHAGAVTLMRFIRGNGEPDAFIRTSEPRRLVRREIY